MNNKKQNNIDNALRVSGSNGYLLRNEILDILLRDETIHDLIAGSYSKNYEHLYWDDGDLVSTHYKNRTIASIGYSYIKKESDQNQTIGDMKKDIIAFCAKQKRKDDEQKLELEHSITILEEIKERLHSEIFYDSNWVEGDGYDQSDFIIGVDIAIDKLNKERK